MRGTWGATIHRISLETRTKSTRDGLAMMGIFDDVPRAYKGPARYGENRFSFINRSGRATVGAVRKVLEEWFTRYPNAAQPLLRRRFRHEFDSAFFELFIHEWLLRARAQVQVHPEVPNSTRKPDFLASFPGIGSVIVEAVEASDESTREAAKSARLATLYEEVDKLRSPDFFVGLQTISNPSNRQPPARKLRAFLARELRLLDADHVEAEIAASGERALPRLRFQDGDFKIIAVVIPKRREARGKSNARLLGSFPVETRWGGTGGAIKDALQRKAARYGAVPWPYVIAVNVTSKWGFHRDDTARALFGVQDSEISGASAKIKLAKGSDGLWVGPRGPRNKKVSAAITTFVTPWNLPHARLCIYFNPFAVSQAMTFPWPCDTATTTLCWENGTPLGSLFDLPAAWPSEHMDDT